MKLSELNIQTQKDLIREPSTRRDHVEAWLHSKGLHRLGSGSFASVWTDDRTTVVKIFENDPCYAKFVEFCRQNRGDPHLPRISNIFWREKHKVGVVFMEYLVPLQGDRGAITKAMRRFLSAISYWGENYAALANEYRESNPSVAATLEKLRVFMERSSGCEFDLYPANIMQRPDGTLVITDPVMPS